MNVGVSIFVILVVNRKSVTYGKVLNLDYVFGVSVLAFPLRNS